MAYAPRDSFIFLALIQNFDPVIEIFICIFNLYPNPSNIYLLCENLHDAFEFIKFVS